MSAHSLPRLPHNPDLAVFLIREELKSRRFFNTLQHMGLYDSHFQPHLDEAILACLGLTDDSNATFDLYCQVMDTHAEQIGIKNESAEEQAREAYAKLVEIVH